MNIKFEKFCSNPLVLKVSHTLESFEVFSKILIKKILFYSIQTALSAPFDIYATCRSSRDTDWIKADLKRNHFKL